jgi:RNA polymerase sigma-70 factor (ECF subfamily)
MLGSVDEAEDLVQDTFLKAWRSKASFEGRSLFRTWLYRIATNACLNALERRPRRVLPSDVARPVTAETDTADAPSEPPWAPEIPWLQPYPERLVAPAEHQPEEAVATRETIELVYLAALQHLPPRQRAMLILRDALGWSVGDVAALLETTTTSVNSALQRARATLRAHLPTQRAQPSSQTEETVLQRFMDAWERADAAALTALLREDARWAMPPAPLWFDGKGAIANLLARFPIGAEREFRMLATRANGQPAAATYLRPTGEAAYFFAGVHVLRIEDGAIAEIVAFGPELCRAFELPATLPVDR